MQARILLLQLAHEALHRRLCRLDLAEIADLSLPACLGNRNRVLGFRHIDTDVKYIILLHGNVGISQYLQWFVPVWTGR